MFTGCSKQNVQLAFDSIILTQVDKVLAAAGARRHLLEQPDFWALNELVDLAGGHFAALPPWLDNASKKCLALAAAVLLDEEAGQAK